MNLTEKEYHQVELLCICEPKLVLEYNKEFREKAFTWDKGPAAWETQIQVAT